jgi:hypothetical protein
MLPLLRDRRRDERMADIEHIRIRYDVDDVLRVAFLSCGTPVPVTLAKKEVKWVSSTKSISNLRVPLTNPSRQIEMEIRIQIQRSHHP